VIRHERNRPHLRSLACTTQHENAIVPGYLLDGTRCYVCYRTPRKCQNRGRALCHRARLQIKRPTQRAERASRPRSAERHGGMPAPADSGLFSKWHARLLVAGKSHKVSVLGIVGADEHRWGYFQVIPARPSAGCSSIHVASVSRARWARASPRARLPRTRSASGGTNPKFAFIGWKPSVSAWVM